MFFRMLTFRANVGRLEEIYKPVKYLQKIIILLILFLITLNDTTVLFSIIKQLHVSYTTYTQQYGSKS